MTLSDLIQEGLKQQALSRVNLADDLRVSTSSVAKWLRRDRFTPIPWRGIGRGSVPCCRFPGLRGSV